MNFISREVDVGSCVVSKRITSLVYSKVFGVERSCQIDGDQRFSPGRPRHLMIIVVPCRRLQSF